MGENNTYQGLQLPEIQVVAKNPYKLTDFQRRDLGNLNLLRRKRGQSPLSPKQYYQYLDREHKDAQSTIKYGKAAAAGIMAGTVAQLALPAAYHVVSAIGGNPVVSTIAKHVARPLELKWAYDSTIGEKDGLFREDGIAKTYRNFRDGDIPEGIGSAIGDVFNVGMTVPGVGLVGKGVKALGDVKKLSYGVGDGIVNGIKKYISSTPKLDNFSSGFFGSILPVELDYTINSDKYE